jgi:hypothetical protein
MKIRIFLFLSMMIAGMAFISSCSTSDTVDPVDVKPTINFIGGTGFISANATVPAGSAIKMGINAFANSTSIAKLVNLTITRVFNNTPVIVLDSTINVSSYSYTFTSEARSEVGPETWYFKVTDKDNQTNQVSLIITTESAAGPINTFSMKILGSYNSATGSSFASIDGTVYTLANAKANSAKIDWLYYYGEGTVSNHATIASPKDSLAGTVFNEGPNNLASWSVHNNTLFKKVTDPIVWASITDDEEIVAQTASGVTNTYIPQLVSNDVLAFITVSGKKGLIKVESISGTGAGTMTISVKVQQ